MLDRFETAEVILYTFRLSFDGYGNYDRWMISREIMAEDRIAGDL